MRVEPIEYPLRQRPGSDSSGDAQADGEREEVRLLAAIAGGNPRSLAELYQRRSGLIYSLLVRMLDNEMEAQEVMQDTFVQLWRNAGDFDADRSSPIAWMIMIARGRAQDRLRARKRRRVGLAAYEQELATLEVEINGTRQTERNELASACVGALNQLPESQAQALQLAFLRGWTHDEIAGAVGEPLGTIKARIRRGLLALRQALKDHHD